MMVNAEISAVTEALTEAKLVTGSRLVRSDRTLRVTSNILRSLTAKSHPIQSQHQTTTSPQ